VENRYPLPESWIPFDRFEQRIALLVTNPLDETLRDFQVEVLLENEELSGINDTDSIRFCDSDGGTLLPFFIESFTAGDFLRAWVKIPTLEPYESKVIWLYSGLSGAENRSNPEATFDFWDDFLGTTLDPIWTVHSGNYSVSNSELTINVGAVALTNPLGLKLQDGYLVEWKVKYKLVTDKASGACQIASSRWTQDANAGSDALAFAQRTPNSTIVYIWAADGTTASYQVSKKTFFTSSDNVYYIIGMANHDGKSRFHVNYQFNPSYSTDLTFTKNLRFISLGRYNGDSIYDIQDTVYDWVRVRKYHSGMLKGPAVLFLGRQKLKEEFCLSYFTFSPTPSEQSIEERKLTSRIEKPEEGEFAYVSGEEARVMSIRGTLVDQPRYGKGEKTLEEQITELNKLLKKSTLMAFYNKDTGPLAVSFSSIRFTREPGVLDSVRYEIELLAGCF